MYAAASCIKKHHLQRDGACNETYLRLFYILQHIEIPTPVKMESGFAISGVLAPSRESFRESVCLRC